jgi:hypothetical protein
LVGIFALADHTVSEHTIVSSLVVYGSGSEYGFDMIHDGIELVIYQMTVIHIHDLPKLSLSVEAHRPVAQDLLLFTTSRDKVAEGVLDLVSISSHIGSSQDGLDFAGDALLVYTALDSLMLEL